MSSTRLRASPSQERRGYRVVMIDDSPTELRWLQRALGLRGYEVVTCNLALGVQAFVTQQEPDVILMDVNMPALNGDTLCRMLKANPHTQRVPVLLYSSLPVGELNALARRCGADGVVVKNHDTEALLEQLSRVLQGRD